MFVGVARAYEPVSNLKSALRITTRLCLLLLLAFVRLVLIAVEQPLSTLMQEFPYFKWLAGIVKHFIPWLSTSLFFPQCLSAMFGGVMSIIATHLYPI